ncbi:hypothetical protein PM082_013690 [Marasmius tenuissimus]|nr:hypothetical protein PM082_013690 [Marasmius tenuissimus]
MRDQFENRRFYLFSTLLLFAICTLMVIDVTVFRMLIACAEYDFAKTKDWRPYIDYTIYNQPKLACYTGYFAIPPLANSLLFLGASVTAAVGYGNWRFEWGVTLSKRADTLRFVGGLASAVVNVLVTLLTAGRIWWVNRQSQAHLGVSEKKDTRKLSTAIRIILESGIIYPVVMAIQITAGEPRNGGSPSVDLTSVVVLSAVRTMPTSASTWCSLSYLCPPIGYSTHVGPYTWTDDEAI